MKCVTEKYDQMCMMFLNKIIQVDLDDNLSNSLFINNYSKIVMRNTSCCQSI